MYMQEMDHPLEQEMSQCQLALSKLSSGVLKDSSMQRWSLWEGHRTRTTDSPSVGSPFPKSYWYVSSPLPGKL